jgi:ribosomal protein S3AE
MEKQTKERIRIAESLVDKYINETFDEKNESIFPMDSPHIVSKEKVLTDNEEDDKQEIEEMLEILESLKSG